MPAIEEKTYWRRYIYLWLNYAAFEEQNGDKIRAQHILERVMKLIPHSKFTFSKVWIASAKLQIRSKNLVNARKILGMSLGKCPRKKIFDFYIDLELKLGEIERCRKIFTRKVEVFSFDSDAWISYALFEDKLGETDRARTIFDISISEAELDLPELLWKAYIDFEIVQKEMGKARSLFEKLLLKSKGVQVWESYAEFEQQIDVSKCREIYQRAAQHF